MNEFGFAGADTGSMEFANRVREYSNKVTSDHVWNQAVEYSKELPDSGQDIARTYGLEKCSDAAKDIFTESTIREWSDMPLEKRREITQLYADKICSGLDIQAREIHFERMPANYAGYNDNGEIYLNENLLGNPAEVMKLADTVAHELRHQFQREAIANPSKYGISQEVANEWATALSNYTTESATKYNPWGYFYNPAEIDARYFGETMVREITKDIINDSPRSKGDAVSFTASKYDDDAYNIKAMKEALNRGDLNNAEKHAKRINH